MSVKPPEEDLESQLSGHMSFLDHLEELRMRIFRVLIAVALTFFVSFAFNEELLQIVSVPIMEALEAADSPVNTLIFTSPTQPFNLSMKVSFLAAVFLASPFILAQVWLFIAPGLYRHERRYAVPFILSTSVLALLGGLFGYWIAFPFALEFLINWGQDSGLQPMIDATQYFNLFLMIEMGLGVIFQIPPVIFVLSRIGLVTPGFLLRNTKYAVLIAFIVAAVITPTADIPNMMIMAGPMILLYLVGVAVSYVFGRPRRKE